MSEMAPQSEWAHLPNPAAWVPGDPLGIQPARGYGSRELYNFRDITESAECFCADAARWPTPQSQAQDLERYPDELTVFIDEVRAERELEALTRHAIEGPAA